MKDMKTTCLFVNSVFQLYTHSIRVYSIHTCTSGKFRNSTIPVYMYTTCYSMHDEYVLNYTCIHVHALTYASVMQNSRVLHNAIVFCGHQHAFLVIMIQNKQDTVA
jgi:hypothetical protein